MEYTRSIAFDEKPDYKYLRGLFDKTFIEMDFIMDYDFCWHIHKREIIQGKMQKEQDNR